MPLRSRLVRTAATLVLIGLAVSACGGAADTGVARGCADVVGVEVIAESKGRYTFAVTVRSDDEGWDAYADVWDVLGPDGDVIGTRVLAHPHVDEQPFTRSLAGVVIPEGVSDVTVRAHHSVGGYCGDDMVAAVPS